MPTITENTRKAQQAPPGRQTTELSVAGMTCGNCARHVNEALLSVQGVQSANVSLDAHQATVRWQPGAQADVQAIIQAVEKEGYEAEVLTTQTRETGEHTLAGWRWNLLLGIPVTALLMIGEWALGLGMARWFQWTAFGLAGLVQVLAGARFYRGAWRQFKARSSNMDTLVALGSSTAFGYSTWALLSRTSGHAYFMEAASIITLVSLGHWLESRVSVRASSALRRLLDLAPATARRRNPDGTDTEVPAAELSPGEVVALRAGERIPTDGLVLEGVSTLDESMLTGESVPVDKAPGQELYAGTVNLTGPLLMRVTAIGEETALAHIIAAVQRAQTSRAGIQRLGDRVSNVFVPVVVAIALAAGLWWGLAPESARLVHQWLAQFAWLAQPPESAAAAGFIIASAVLIIACPCAMGLATPAAIMAGSNAAAARGILVRDGVALEKAGRVTAVVFDKTGTLTTGKPAVVEGWEGGSTVRLAEPAVELPAGIRLGVALARHSNHPISQALAKLAGPDVALTDWREQAGAGIVARLTPSAARPLMLAVGQGTSPALCRLGSLRWLRESGVELGTGEEFIRTWSTKGATLIGVAVDHMLVGLVAVKDTVKPGARGVVGQLQRQGLKTYMVTGDNSLTAASIAQQAGLATDTVFAEVRPDQKAGFVKRLQEQGERVAFVGDGINDAPALEQADLGIAVSRASDIAREAADLILLKSEIEAVPESLGLARATLRTIHQNLFWAFFYNAVGIPLAALGFMSPILCAAAMGLSDLVVIGNALRLRHWRA
ncbi:MAG TPA: cation-translocating P-type ATPase [Verrucomicrobiae bacterium]|nr:cation-translocating P-type ATPase [Verrucomicrobiae bacterium]